jgi:ribosome maturation factor RimP
MSVLDLSPSTIEQFLAAHFPDAFLVSANVQRGGKHLVAVVVDTDAGVGVDTLGRINRQLRAWLETHGLIDDSYEVFVGSPGIFEPLKLQRQFQKHIGRTVACVMKNGTKHEGTLLAASPQALQLLPPPPKKKKAKATDPPAAPEEPQPLTLAQDEIKETTLVVKF